MPELSSAPADPGITGFEKLLTLDFQYLELNLVLTWVQSELNPSLIPFSNSAFAATNVEDAILEAAGGGGGGSVAGSDKQVQYNNSGAFGAEAGFEYDASTNTLTVSNITTAGLLLTAASATGGAGFRVPHGAAPTTPTNGDIWTTTAGMFVRVNGVTVGPLSSSAGGVSSVNGDTGAVIVLAPIIVACSDETTALTTGSAKATFRMPYAMTLTGVRASVTVAPTGSVLTVDINENGVSILSTAITIDATEKTSTTAAVPPVISDTALADDAEITIDIDTVGSTVAGVGLKVTLIGYAS